MFFFAWDVWERVWKKERKSVYVLVGMRVPMCDREAVWCFSVRRMLALLTQLWQLTQCGRNKWAGQQSGNTHTCTHTHMQYSEWVLSYSMWQSASSFFHGGIWIYVCHMSDLCPPRVHVCARVFSVCMQAEAELEGCHHAKINRVWIYKCWFLPSVILPALQTVLHRHCLPGFTLSWCQAGSLSPGGVEE